MSKECKECIQKEEELETTQTELEQAQIGLARVQADFQNFQRRTAEQAQQQKQRAAEQLIKDLLSIVDNMELALLQVSKDQRNDFYKGIELILGQFITLLQDNGVTHIPTDEFNPAHHEAILTESSEQPKGSIIEVLQPGYLLGGVVLRTAKVKVSSGQEEEK